MTGWGCGFWEADHTGNCHSSHYVKGATAYILSVKMTSLLILTLITSLSGFSVENLLEFSLLSTVHSLEGNPRASVHLRNGELDSTSLRRKNLYKLFGIPWEICLPHLFIYSTIYFYLWKHGYLFYTLSYNPIYFIFVVYNVLTLAFENSFTRFLCFYLFGHTAQLVGC